jgi:CBS-domain-containing membrane protein
MASIRLDLPANAGETLVPSAIEEPPMTCRAIMTPEPMTLRETDSIRLAADRLLANRFILLPAVSDTGHYVGAFGVFELVALLLPKIATVDELVADLSFMADDLTGLRERYALLADGPVGPHVRTDLPVVRADTPIPEALLLFHRNRFTLPVVEAGGRLLGIVSYWDALAAVIKGVA